MFHLLPGQQLLPDPQDPVTTTSSGGLPPPRDAAGKGYSWVAG